MMYRLRLAAALAALSGALVCALAWQNLHPSYTGLAFGGGNFVAVSSDGLINVGSGGGQWEQYYMPSSLTRGLHGAAYGGGQFIVTHVAVGSPTIFRSNDGRSWSTQTISSAELCRRIVYGGDEVGFVGAGEGTVFVFDGNNWERYSALQYADYLSHAAYGAGRIVAVGSDIISATPDYAEAGIWATASGISTAGGVSAVAFGGDRFVAIAANGSTVYRSENGQSWTSAASSGAPAGMVDITYGGGKFVAVGLAGKAAVSADGSQWTVSTLNANDNFVAVKYGGDRFMALGARGSVYTSADGSSWTKQVDGRLMTYRQIVYGGSMFAAVGDSGISVSSDGKNWVRANVEGSGFRGVTYGAGKFVAVGDSGAIYTSSDGNNWTGGRRPDGTMFNAVAFGNNVFIAGGMTRPLTGTLGGPGIFTSEDGQTWLDRSIDISTAWQSTMFPTAIAFGGEHFVAGANNGAILRTTSSDAPGRYWGNVATPAQSGSSRITSIAYSEGRFTALGTAGTGATLITSTDGASGTWENVQAPASARSATFAKGAYVVAADSGNIFSSPDGNQWGVTRRATNKNLTVVYFGNDVLLAGGVNGALLYSNESPVSVRHTPQPGAAAPRALGMTLERVGRTPTLTLSFTPQRAGTIAVYTLAGRRIYNRNVSAGENIIPLPSRLTASGSVIVRYADGNGVTVSQRFQMVR